MKTETIKILKAALKLPVKDRVDLTDQLLTSLDQPDSDIDRLWRLEVESRIQAYNTGKIKSVPLEKVFAKYHK